MPNNKIVTLTQEQVDMVLGGTGTCNCIDTQGVITLLKVIDEYNKNPTSTWIGNVWEVFEVGVIFFAFYSTIQAYRKPHTD